MLAVVAVAGAVGSGALRAAGRAQTLRPALRLVDSSPLTLRGTGFRAGEHVTVRLATGRGRAIGRTVANARGSFRSRFPKASANACAGLSATAVGDRGSRASFKRAPGECPVP